jgi:hypothetical protein
MGGKELNVMWRFLMKKNGFTGLIFALLLLPVFLLGCPGTDSPGSEPGPGPGPGPEPEPYIPVPIGNYSGTGIGISRGFAKSDAYVLEHGSLGRDITVTVTMVNGWMTEVVIDGPDETPTLGGQLVRSLGPIIKENNTFDVDRIDGVEGISGATFTFNGIKEAGEKAINEIKNE